MKNKAVVSMVLCALFAALTAILAQFSIPIGPVPINLTLFAIFLSGAVLGAKYGAVSQAVYILLGLVGIPVFSGFTSGIRILVGPTGGYIISYVLVAFLVGLAREKFGARIPVLALSMVVGLAVCYLFGTAWFIFVTKTGIWRALVLCVFPFLIGDAAKIVAATLIAPQLLRATKKFTTANHAA